MFSKKAAALPYVLVCVGWFLHVFLPVQAQASSLAVYQFDNAAQEAQYRALITEFRCPKCQNQNLAGSDSVIAQNLKQKTYELVKAGKTDKQIRDYMVARYGDFISYKPPVNAATGLLWFFPPLLLLGAFAWWLWWPKLKRSKLKNQAREEMLSAAEQQKLTLLLAQHNQQKEQPND